MGKTVFLVIVFLLFFTACSRERNSTPDAVSAATLRKGPPARKLLEKHMPEAMADGIVKIAVIVNLEAGDPARQFIDGCVSEGRSMGFNVDAFIIGTDEQKCRDLAARIAGADYDGVIFSNGSDVLAYDSLRPLADRNLPIVTFEAFPIKGGRTISGITAAFLDEDGLANLSLATLISYIGAGNRPPAVIRIGTEAGVPFMVKRDKVFNDFLNEGKIKEAALVNLRDLENPAASAREGLAAILSRFPQGTIDAIWSPYEEFAAGCAQALAAAGRSDIKLFSIGISNEVIRLMQRHSDIWPASTAIDTKLAGTVCMRILAAKLAGETLPGTFSFTPKLVRTEDLNRNINIANISVMLPHWGEGEGLFDFFPWMEELKTAESKYLRIPP